MKISTVKELKDFLSQFKEEDQLQLAIDHYEDVHFYWDESWQAIIIHTETY